MKVVLPVLGILAAAAVPMRLAWLAFVWSLRGAGGDLVSEERTLPPFTQVVIEGFADVTLVQGRAR